MASTSKNKSTFCVTCPPSLRIQACSPSTRLISQAPELPTTAHSKAPTSWQAAPLFYANSDFLLEKSQDEREFHKACWTAMHQSFPIKTASYQGSVGKLSAARRALLYTRHQRDYSHEVFFARFCNCRRWLQQHHPGVPHQHVAVGDSLPLAVCDRRCALRGIYLPVRPPLRTKNWRGTSAVRRRLHGGHAPIPWADHEPVVRLREPLRAHFAGGAPRLGKFRSP